MQVTERWGAGVETLLGSRLKMAVLKVNNEYQADHGSRITCNSYGIALVKIYSPIVHDI